MPKKKLQTTTLGPESGPIYSVLEGHVSLKDFNKAFKAEGWDNGGWNSDLVEKEYWRKSPKGRRWTRSTKDDKKAIPVTVGYW